MGEIMPLKDFRSQKTERIIKNIRGISKDSRFGAYLVFNFGGMRRLNGLLNFLSDKNDYESLKHFYELMRQLYFAKFSGRGLKRNDVSVSDGDELKRAEIRLKKQLTSFLQEIENRKQKSA